MVEHRRRPPTRFPKVAVLTRSSLLLIIHHFLHSGSGQQSLHPSVVVWVFAFEVHFLVTHDEGQHSVPRDEAEIRIGASTADKVLLSFQCRVQNHCYTLDFIPVSFDGGGDFLRMKVAEPARVLGLCRRERAWLSEGGIPCALTEIGALSRHLEMEPL